MPLAGRNRRRWSLSAVRPGGDIAVDLGTANTVVYVRGRGIVLSEPSVVAIDQRTGEVHAVGADAQRMIGRTPATISADRPLRHGVIADFEVTEAMLRQFVGKVLHNRFARPRMVICAPSGITEVERRAVEEATLSRGRPRGPPDRGVAGRRDRRRDRHRRARRPHGRRHRRRHVRGRGHLARAAWSSRGRCGSAATTSTTRSRTTSGSSTGWRSAPRAPRRSSSPPAPRSPLAEEIETSIRGRDLASGLPREILLTSEEVRQAIAAPLAEIMTAIHATLEETPPELAADITTEGVLLAGGGSLLRGFDERVGARDRHAGPPRRRPAGLRRHGRRHVARGARHAPPRPRAAPLLT